MSASALPTASTMLRASKIAITDDKPIVMDYWVSSINKQSLLGVKADGERMLVKSEDEYTSTVTKIFKNQLEYIVVTENSIYIVSVDIPSRQIS